MKERQGFIISLSTADNLYIGLGEVSPLDGVHHETVDEAQSQIELLKERLMRLTFPDIPSLPCESILALDGSLELFIHSLYSQIFPVGDSTNYTQLLPSVRAGLEMALLSIASQAEKMTLVDAILRKPSVPTSNDRIDSPMLLPLNGLVTKDETSSQSRPNKQDRVSYTSTKVKVGESSPFEDAQRMLRSVSEQTLLRADANRSWNETQAFDFVMFLKALDPSSIDSLEFVEEPLIRVLDGKKAWDLGDQLEALERFYDETGIKYALDESLADIAMSLDFKFQPIADNCFICFTTELSMDAQH
jgi:O-succinylbenzoate synthase